jgi:hypothetical protein
MKRVQAWLLMGVLVGVSLAGAGCATQDGLAVARAAPCPGGKWVTARRGTSGGWTPGHWRCPDSQN